MIHTKKEGVVGDFAKRGEDIKRGDRIALTSQGREVLSQFKKKDGSDQYQTIFSINTRNGVKNVAMNQTSINALVDAYGEDDRNWVGKTLNVLVVVVPGKAPYYYFAPDGYEIGENGLEKIGGQPEYKEELPTIQVEDDRVNLSDIPF